MRHYQQLNKEERFYIWNALRSGQTQKMDPGLRPHTTFTDDEGITLFI